MGPQEPLLATVRRWKLAWFRHVTHHDSLSKTILQDTLEGGQCCGQQRKCWMDNIKERTSLPMPKLLTKASCRKDWKKISAESSLVPPPPPPQLVKGLNWTELNDQAKVGLKEGWSWQRVYLPVSMKENFLQRSGLQKEVISHQGPHCVIYIKGSSKNEPFALCKCFVVALLGSIVRKVVVLLGQMWKNLLRQYGLFT